MTPKEQVHFPLLFSLVSGFLETRRTKSFKFLAFSRELINYVRLFLHFFRDEKLDVDIEWYNPYRGLTMLQYNPLDGRLYFFDAKRLLSVNVKIEGEKPEEPDSAIFS